MVFFLPARALLYMLAGAFFVALAGEAQTDPAGAVAIGSVVVAIVVAVKRRRRRKRWEAAAEERRLLAEAIAAAQLSVNRGRI